MKNRTTWKEFKPALRFLLVFVASYFVGNVLYGLYVEAYNPLPDPMTVWVTVQVAQVLSTPEIPVSVLQSTTEPIVWLVRDTKTILGIFEGCNGLNVVIVFISFLVAFGGRVRVMVIYVVGGSLVLHAANLLRISLLYQTALYRPLVFYYFHKYFFTAVLYFVVFALWFQWTRIKSSSRVSAKN